MNDPFRRIQVLLVEDNPGDADLTRDALEELKINVQLTVVEDGEKAMGVLRSGRSPDLVLLDLNLPRMSGQEVLAEMRADEALRHIPVVVLSSSEAERDVVSSYGLGANCYVTKPLDLGTFHDIIRETADFWFTVVKLPTV